jgi:predicted phosphodiesterase
VRVAVLSDIHSNVTALRAVLEDVERTGVEEVWVGGDTFGYYPWAADTFTALSATQPICVLGNHDSWVVRGDGAPPGLLGAIARDNAGDLAENAPDGLRWLAKLAPLQRMRRAERTVTIAHGTPADALEGRYYPDDERAYDWLPGHDEVLILGQTHYPLVRRTARGGLLVNPGSVGQPRDGNPMPSWAVLDLECGCAELRRCSYDNVAVIASLRARRWHERATRALDKRTAWDGRRQSAPRARGAART